MYPPAWKLHNLYYHHTYLFLFLGECAKFWSVEWNFHNFQTKRKGFVTIWASVHSQSALGRWWYFAMFQAEKWISTYWLCWVLLGQGMLRIIKTFAIYQFWGFCATFYLFLTYISFTSYKQQVRFSNFCNEFLVTYFVSKYWQEKRFKLRPKYIKKCQYG